MPLPISAAWRAKSDRLGFLDSPSAAAFCASVSSDRRWDPTLDEFWRRCACARTDLNSAVRSWTDATAMAGCDYVWNRVGSTKKCDQRGFYRARLGRGTRTAEDAFVGRIGFVGAADGSGVDFGGEQSSKKREIRYEASK